MSKEKTIAELVADPRVIEALTIRFNATIEEKLEPEKFVKSKIKEWLKEIVLAHEEDKAIKEARLIHTQQKEEFIV